MKHPTIEHDGSISEVEFDGELMDYFKTPIDTYRRESFSSALDRKRLATVNVLVSEWFMRDETDRMKHINNIVMLNTAWMFSYAERVSY